MIVKIADIVSEAKLRYKYTFDMCSAYLYDGDEKPAFTTFASNEQIADERKKNPGFPDYIIENTCIYRNICHEMLKFNAIFIHSAAICVDNEAYLFSANSGTGKTTHINLWLAKFGDRAFIINGDKPILRMINDTIYAYGTPWCGKELQNKNVRVPLKSICILERGSENIIEPANKNEAAIFLLSQTTRPKDKFLAELMLEKLEMLVNSVPIYNLHCNMEKEACEVSYNAMSK